jgi:hypothetical protein
MTVSTFTIGNITIENNYPAINIVENFYASAKERQTLYTIVAVSKGVYTFVGANDWDAFHNEVFINGTFASAQLAAEAAFNLAVKTATELEAAFNATADAANQLLHIDIQNEVAEQDAAQAASEAIAEANNGLDYIACYIEGIENKDLSSELAAPQNDNLVRYLLGKDVPINAKIMLNGGIFYVDKILIETCFEFGDIWDFIGSKYAPEKTVLMAYLAVVPVAARRQTQYPSECDYRDYAYGGDGYTADEVLDI